MGLGLSVRRIYRIRVKGTSLYIVIKPYELVGYACSAIGYSRYP